MTRNIWALGPLALASACHHAPAPDPAKPDAYRQHIAFTPASGGSLQRLELPAAALAAFQRTDLGDVRVFDAQGKLVALAHLTDPQANARHTTSLPIFPITGPITASALSQSGMSISVTGEGAARVVTLAASAKASTATPPAAALLDTHALREPVSALGLDIAIPTGQPVMLTLLSSADLKDWQPLAQKVLFRPADGPALLGGGEVALQGVDLHGRYVAISWGEARGVTLNGARAITASHSPPAQISIATSGARLNDAHHLRFDLPAMAHVAAIRLSETGPDGIIPVRLYGSIDGKDPWTLLSATTLQAGETGAAMLDMPGPSITRFRLEADSRTAGFSATPKVELLFDPVTLLVALSGTPPYRLAVGQASAAPAYLALSEIAPASTPPALADLPHASFVSPAAAAPVINLQAARDDNAWDRRKLVLWAALLLATLTLGLAAIRLLRGGASGAKPGG